MISENVNYHLLFQLIFDNYDSLRITKHLKLN
jgi:hypothetical protein